MVGDWQLLSGACLNCKTEIASSDSRVKARELGVTFTSLIVCFLSLNITAFIGKWGGLCGRDLFIITWRSRCGTIRDWGPDSTLRPQQQPQSRPNPFVWSWLVLTPQPQMLLCCKFYGEKNGLLISENHFILTYKKNVFL